jgi:hypothetical protein
MRQRRSARLEVVRQCCSQFDDPTPESSADEIKLYFGARRDVVVPRQHDNPSGRDVALELRDQIGHVDPGHIRNQMVDHHARAGEKMLIAVLPQPVQRRGGLRAPSTEAPATVTTAETVDSTPRAAGCSSPAPLSARMRL